MFCTSTWWEFVSRYQSCHHANNFVNTDWNWVFLHTIIAFQILINQYQYKNNTWSNGVLPWCQCTSQPPVCNTARRSRQLTYFYSFIHFQQLFFHCSIIRMLVRWNIFVLKILYILLFLCLPAATTVLFLGRVKI